MSTRGHHPEVPETRPARSRFGRQFMRFRPMRIKSGLGRSLDFSYPSNRFAVAATIGAGLIAAAAALANRRGSTEVLGDGVLAGGAAFVAWALARELDPDRPVGAGVAAVIAPVVLFAGPPDLLVCGLLVLAARIFAGSTGRVLGLVDLGVIGVWAVPVVFRDAGVPIALIAAIAPAVSAWWHRSAARLLFAASGVILAGVVALAVLFADGGPWPQPTGVARGVLVAGLAAGVVSSWALPRPRSSTDSRRGGIISTQRVRLARLGTLGAGVGAMLWAGEPGVLALGPAWAALAATAVWSIAGLGGEVSGDAAE